MNKTEILNHPAWKYISSLNPSDRFMAIFGSEKSSIEKHFNVDVQSWPYTSLPELPDDCVYISVTDRSLNVATMAVLIPRQ